MRDGNRGHARIGRPVAPRNHASGGWPACPPGRCDRVGGISGEQGAGLGLPIAKSLVDLHGGTFQLKSKLRIGTEVIVTFPPERVVAAMAPMPDEAPSIAPAAPNQPLLSPEEKRRLSRRPLFRVGT